MSARTGVIPVLLFMYGLICFATSATMFMSWALGAFPAVPSVNASLAIAAALGVAGVVSLLIASFQLIAAESFGTRRYAGA